MLTETTENYIFLGQGEFTNIQNLNTFKAKHPAETLANIISKKD